MVYINDTKPILKTASVIDSSNTATDTTVSSVAKTVTSVADNCYAVIMGYSGNNGGHTAGANTTERVDNNYVFGYDSNAAITPAGNHTLNVSYGVNSTFQTWYGSIAPVGATSSRKSLTLLGVS